MATTAAPAEDSSPDAAATADAKPRARRAERAADYADRSVGYVDARARDVDRISRWTVAIALSVGWALSSLR